ncbi:hypothetical protein [Trinickia caryophylli]|uniref:hypothetical protein n=1 Tax=Trinickia caryophylli TaxID=28094 RepID=UPI00111C89A3|nr:hypothetical protein [Trinickia caryophylli]TRX13614.1 hypothetical protein FNF07_19595 [Trinickia caryophylli]WQE15192.1 hypothetical protein U0034_21830 [Trinickia caryophylli]
MNRIPMDPVPGCPWVVRVVLIVSAIGGGAPAATMRLCGECNAGGQRAGVPARLASHGCALR